MDECISVCIQHNREQQYRSKLHYAIFWCEATLPVDWIFHTLSVEKRTMYHWTRNMLKERQCAYKLQEYERGARGNTPMYKPLTQNIQAGCLVWYFDPRIIPGTSHKLRSFWAGPYGVI